MAPVRFLSGTFGCGTVRKVPCFRFGRFLQRVPLILSTLFIERALSVPVAVPEKWFRCCLDPRNDSVGSGLFPGNTDKLRLMSSLGGSARENAHRSEHENVHKMTTKVDIFSVKSSAVPRKAPTRVLTANLTALTKMYTKVYNAMVVIHMICFHMQLCAFPDKHKHTLLRFSLRKLLRPPPPTFAGDSGPCPMGCCKWECSE